MPFNSEQVQKISKSSNDFVYFVNNIFSESADPWIGGQHVDNIARFLSQNDKTIRISARHHFKSYSLYAYIMWKIMFEGAGSGVEIHYFSFNENMAGYNVTKIKKTISDNPFFADLIDMKPTAETIAKYSWDGNNIIHIIPHGLVQFKRGIHGDIIMVDDPLQDPENDLNPVVVFKINEIFSSNILDMPNKPHGELHVVGTPQTKQDFFFDPAVTAPFDVKIDPAIQRDKDTGEEKSLWPEWTSIEELKEIRKGRSERIFRREYMCEPVQSTKAFFSREKLEHNCVNPNLVDLDPHKRHDFKTEKIVAGFDIGRKAHPAHLSVFKLDGDKLKMIHQRFMDNWPYSKKGEFRESRPSQLEYLKMSIKNFCIDELRYDNTRGEFEIFDDQGLLPKEMVPVTFTSKFKSTAATAFDKVVERKQLEIFKNERLLEQISTLTNELQSATGKKGHADAFWSIAMAILCVVGLMGIKELQEDPNYKTSRPSTGGSSIFTPGASIPKGW